jgi:hypothetical protein
MKTHLHCWFPATGFIRASQPKTLPETALQYSNALLVSGNWFHQGVNSRKQYLKQHLNILMGPNGFNKHNMPYDLLVLFLWIASATRANATHQRNKQASATPSALCPT